MDKVISGRNQNFTINDVKLSIDPIQMSVYKEGLQYSWKTLRTKASSKVLNGNSVFHVKLNLIFTKSMFLKMHRLICQIRNSPFVQIENKFISESVTSQRSDNLCWFTVASCQIIPRSDSPYTVDMELDLRYFNFKAFKNDLTYKQFFESKKITKDSKQYVYSFSVFPRDGEYKTVRHELSKEQAPTLSSRRRQTSLDFLKKNINQYRQTAPVRKAAESFAYIRYSNFLQIKSLIDNFGLSYEDLIQYFGESQTLSLDARKAKQLHELSASEEFLNKIYENYDDFTIQYKEYKYLSFTKNEHKEIREFFEKEIGVVN